MHYVFFDIECACVYKDVAKICVFGYCICDEKFNILKKEDILINPNGKFHLTAHGGDGIVLPYNYEDFKKYPDFPAFYRTIKDLLEGGDKIVVGHAAVNDVKYLNLETKRYKLPSFDFEFADTQILYMAMSETFERQTGLDKLTELFRIEFQAHCAADDAYATMKVAEAMCRENQCTFPGLLEKYQIRNGSIRDYTFTNCSSKRGNEYYEKRAREKAERENVRVEFNNFVSRTRMRPQTRELYGKRFTFSRKIEEDLSLSKRLVREICRRGGRYSLKLGAANVFVTEENDESVRSVTAARLAGEGKPLQILHLSDLYSLLELNE